jgi:clan AA aspartic protease (TIGR02281 family)
MRRCQSIRVSRLSPTRTIVSPKAMPRPSKRRRKALLAASPHLSICYALARSSRNRHVLPMVVDTGASVTTIPLKIALSLGLDPANTAEQATIITANGLAYAPIVHVPVFSALGISLQSFPAACHDLPVQSRVRGLLGVDFLAHFPPYRDFQEEVSKIALQFWET